MSKMLNRIKYIYKNEGFISLIKRAFPFLMSLVPFEYHTFYLYERDFREESLETIFSPKVDGLVVRILSTGKQLDELLNESFDLSLLDIEKVKKRLAKGAVLCIAFVDNNPAYMAWSALTEEAKNTFNPYPYKVDFANGEVCGGDVWTNPKYRRRGLHRYIDGYKKKEYLMKKGILKTRYAVLSTNIVGQRATTLRHNRLYAKARYLRIFRLRFWKESPIDEQVV